MTQATALKILKSGANVFLTGEPGSGKSHTVNQYVQYLREHEIEPAITASTGIAATHIGGMTIHSWSGIGIRKVLSDYDLDELSNNERLVKRVSKANVLIIDEVSMLDADTLDAVDAACRALRRRPADAFGGIQIVLVGDFFQLPPVARRGEPRPEFAYSSLAWKAAKPLVCYLSEQHRQEDSIFLQFLASLRKGWVIDGVHDLLDSCRLDEGEDVFDMTRLYSHNVDVDSVNYEKLAGIDEDEHVFEMQSRGSDGLVAQLKKGCLSPEKLHLKVGAQVMFTKNNFEVGYANGTLGQVAGFAASGSPIVLTKDGKRIEVASAEWSIADGSRTLATVIQHPLRLAWAMTVHKSQGMTLDSALIDLSEAFEYGQGYVALSRVKTLAGLKLLGYNARALQVHPKILDVDDIFKTKSNDAEKIYEEMSTLDLSTLHNNFITFCGGTLAKTEIKKKKIKAAKKVKGESTHDVTLSLWKLGKTIQDIADQRGVTKGTIIGHVNELYMMNKIDREDLERGIRANLSEEALFEIKDTIKKAGTDKLTPIFMKLDKKYSYEDIRLAKMLI